MHLATSPAFEENARRAIANPALRKALARSGPAFVARRTRAVAALPEFDRPTSSRPWSWAPTDRAGCTLSWWTTRARRRKDNMR